MADQQACSKNRQIRELTISDPSLNINKNEKVESAEYAEKEAKIIESHKNTYYSQLVLGILTTVYISNPVDRQVINALPKYIIEDLSITDGQFGMLSGLAFAFIYTTLSFPIARWANLNN